ncbi:hypothetical protein DFH11DRAFT_1749257 [Phellopilus nigrolimitatus]|nr:hypothetical protein DFH11DRAFT_1749257 [Phellopilus nigrolimitatus]
MLKVTATARKVRWPASVLEVEAGREGARWRQSRITGWSAVWCGIESTSGLHMQPLPLLRACNLLHAPRLLEAMVQRVSLLPSKPDCFGVRKAAWSKRAWSCSRCRFAQRQLKYDRADKSSTSMSIPISMRRHAVAVTAAGSSAITTTPFPVNYAVPRPTVPTSESASPPANPGLKAFSAEEQATICSFLSAVGMSEAEALADDGAGYAAALDADIEANVATLERGRAVERLQALDVRDHWAHASAAIRVRVQIRLEMTWY